MNANSRRALLMQTPIGAGGFAAHTVPLADPNRVVGASGFNAETNPTMARDDAGNVIDFPTQDGTYRPAHFEVVQSWRRDETTYPDPWTFRLNFANPLREVHAIEVVSLNVPNVDGGNPEPAFREFLLLNGLLRETSSGSGEYRFRGQENIAKDRSFHTMVAHNMSDPNVDHGGTDLDNLQLDDSALGRFQYDSTAPFQYWRSSGGIRQTTWFPTPITRLAHLEFTLADTFGEPYLMNTAENWTATLQIFSKGG